MSPTPLVSHLRDKHGGCHALEIRSSAGREPKGSGRTSMDPVAAVAVVSGAGHVVELPDAGHHSAGVLLLHGLA